MEIDSNNSPQRNSSNCRRKERERKKVGRLVGSSWEVGNERKREKDREREKKKRDRLLVTGHWTGLTWSVSELACSCRCAE
jgi:hypothetical protein